MFDSRSSAFVRSSRGDGAFELVDPRPCGPQLCVGGLQLVDVGDRRLLEVGRAGEHRGELRLRPLHLGVHALGAGLGADPAVDDVALRPRRLRRLGPGGRLGEFSRLGRRVRGLDRRRRLRFGFRFGCRDRKVRGRDPRRRRPFGRVGCGRVFVNGCGACDLGRQELRLVGREEFARGAQRIRSRVDTQLDEQFADARDGVVGLGFGAVEGQRRSVHLTERFERVEADLVERGGARRDRVLEATTRTRLRSESAPLARGFDRGFVETPHLGDLRKRRVRTGGRGRRAQRVDRAVALPIRANRVGRGGQRPRVLVGSVDRSRFGARRVFARRVFARAGVGSRGVLDRGVGGLVRRVAVHRVFVGILGPIL